MSTSTHEFDVDVDDSPGKDGEGTAGGTAARMDRALLALIGGVGPEFLGRMQSKDVLHMLQKIGMAMDSAEAREAATHRLREVRWYRHQLSKLLAMPQVAQRSQEWYELRKNRLTASDLAQALGKGKFGSRLDLLEKKVSERAGKQSSIDFNIPPLKWGVMFEPMAARVYSERNDNVKLHEFGLIPHPKVACFGASPDAISDLGIMVEFKCPYRRKIIPGDIPEQYQLQMQGQLAVCGLRECDYVECVMQAYYASKGGEAAYFEEVPAGARTDHGVIIEYATAQQTVYDYSPPGMRPAEAWAWAQAEAARRMREDEALHLVQLLPWRLQEVQILRVHLDEEAWEELVPAIEAFWREVITTSLEDIMHARAVLAASKGPKRSRKSPEKQIQAPVTYEFLDEEGESDDEVATG